MAVNNPKAVYKILIIGDAMVGKSCILQRYADDKYSENISPTIGVDYRPVHKKFRGHWIKLMIWDTAGQEKFKSITMSFYHGTHGAIVVYDVTQKDSLYRLTKWIGELRRICGDIPIIIIGNKCDSRPRFCIPQDEISQFIDEIGYTEKHFIGSALTGENISEAFEALTSSLVAQDPSTDFTEDGTITLRDEKRDQSLCFC